jgi:hypothetical protein
VTNNGIVECRAEIQRGRVGNCRAFQTDKEAATPIIIIGPVRWLHLLKNHQQEED